MRFGMLVVLGLALLAVLWWRRGEAVAPSGTENAAMSAEEVPAALQARIEEQPFVLAESVAREAIEEPAVVAATAAPEERVITLRGRLFDPEGRGVRGTVHRYERPLDPGYSWQDRPRIATAEDGTFSIRLHAGVRSALVGSAKGFVPSEARLLVASDATAEVTLLLQSYTEVRGVIVDEHGAPRSGDVMLGAEPSMDADGSWLPWVPELLLTDADWRNPNQQVKCAEDGSFAFPKVIPRERVTLSYSADSFSTAFVQWKDIRPGDRALRLVVQSDDLRCGRVTGTVRGPDGAPVTRYEIQVDGRFWRDVSNPDGRFDLRAQWGSEAPILVRADLLGTPAAVTSRTVMVPSRGASTNAPMHWVGTCRIDCASQELPALQLLPLGELTVRVTDRDGKAVDQAALRLEMDTHAMRGSAVWQPFDGWPVVGTTDAHGEARIVALGAGPYRVRGMAHGKSFEAQATVRSGAHQTIDVVVDAR